ncbi:MAG: Rne/Rng family ribonuclease [Rickettsiales bacterium]|jgi:ribonuclease E|nr:Rne/Rng family ribonuclease [Rickettsiales bacterium]
MSNRLLVDAAFPEETRVAVLNERNVLENVDMETSSIKQLKGNVYLAKIIRLEPSLQAAFINYGSDRHGFLPMSDVHPDYYNIPENRKNDLSAVRFFAAAGDGTDSSEEEPEEAGEEDFADENLMELDENGEPIILPSNDNPEIAGDEGDEPDYDHEPEDPYVGRGGRGCEEIGDDETEHRRNGDFRKYRIENVLREGQTLMVQVLKEERGNKGVALTTYISLAGRYSVLMANTDGKGGISKKITNVRDRKILKNILNTLNPTNNRSIIIRTAGIGRKPEEISRDYVYLIRLWEAIKQVSLSSEAPVFIHSEDDILKRTIRDLYNDRIGDILVEGANAYKSIRSMLKTIMPEEKITVQNYSDRIPLFHRFRVEEQIEQLYNNRVELPSGGSIVIDQTEALVAIDVNSGKSTREKSVEEMALATNIEAAREIARQLRLRNIGGLLVVDFIDMYESRNRRTVERILREETALDRAKTQIDRISIFGLLEISRQRVQASLYESVNEKCSKCDGHGTIRSKYIVANNILRSIKVASRERFVKVVEVSVSGPVANFMLNYQRREIMELEKNYGLTIVITANDNLDSKFEIKKRSSLSDQEKGSLHLDQHMGKVNRTFEDEVFYSAGDGGSETHFADDCYYDRTDETKSSTPKNTVDRGTANRRRSGGSGGSGGNRNGGEKPKAGVIYRTGARQPSGRQQSPEGKQRGIGLFSKLKNFLGFSR